jgi:hypothetical protein
MGRAEPRRIVNLAESEAMPMVENRIRAVVAQDLEVLRAPRRQKGRNTDAVLSSMLWLQVYGRWSAFPRNSTSSTSCVSDFP